MMAYEDDKDKAQNWQRVKDNYAREHGQGGYGSGGSSGSGCFPAYSLVLTPGGWRQIAQIRPGDEVLSYSKGTDEVEICTVLRRKDHGAERLWRLEFEDNAPPVVTTRSHSFLTERGWIKAIDLKRGDILMTAPEPGNANRVVSAVRLTAQSAPVYNLITSDHHTFIVEGLIAHNFSTIRELRTWLHRNLIDPILRRRFRRQRKAAPVTC